jgi:hypothetical protein
LFAAHTKRLGNSDPGASILVEQGRAEVNRQTGFQQLRAGF